MQWLNLDRLASMRPDNRRFPAWTDALAADMRQETIDVFMDRLEAEQTLVLVVKCPVHLPHTGTC